MTKMRSIAAGAALFVASASTGLAQVVNYTTTGRFTSGNAGCNSAIASLSANCGLGAFNLLYSGTTGTNIGNGSVVSLGSFLLSGGPGALTVPAGTVAFELFISQTTPSVGSSSFMGSITGSVTVGPGGNMSSLVWLPSQQIRSIGLAQYQLIFDNVGPAANRGLAVPVNNMRGIEAVVNVVPEPSSVVLMGTGFAVLFGMALRRKNA